MNELLPLSSYPSLNEAFSTPLGAKQTNSLSSDTYNGTHRTYPNLAGSQNTYSVSKIPKEIPNGNNPYAKFMNRSSPDSYMDGDYANVQEYQAPVNPYVNHPPPSTSSAIGSGFSENLTAKPPFAHNHSDSALHLATCSGCKEDLSSLVSKIVSEVLQSMRKEMFTNYFPENNTNTTYPYSQKGWSPFTNFSLDRNTRDIVFVLAGVFILFLMFLVVVRAMK